MKRLVSRLYSREARPITRLYPDTVTVLLAVRRVATQTVQYHQSQQQKHIGKSLHFGDRPSTLLHEDRTQGKEVEREGKEVKGRGGTEVNRRRESTGRGGTQRERISSDCGRDREIAV